MHIAEVVADRLQTNAAYRRLFDTEDGKTVLRHLIRAGFVMNTTFVAGDHNQTVLNEGSRRMVLSILKKANVDPKELLNTLEQELQNAR